MSNFGLVPLESMKRKYQGNNPILKIGEIAVLPPEAGETTPIMVLGDGKNRLSALKLIPKSRFRTEEWIINLLGSYGGSSSVTSVAGRTGAVVLNKSDVGLTNVDNTSDADKPVSTLQAASIATKENSITAGTTSQYWRGDKSWQTLNKTAVGLANVDNTSDADKPVSTLQAASIATKENTITAGITSQYWRGDKSWQTLNKSAVGLGNVDNTSDANKPVSTATQTALDNETNARIDSDALIYSEVTNKSDIGHTHPPTDIIEDSSHRFVTDAEKSTWNAGGVSVNKIMAFIEA